MTWVKICGITNLDDALVAVDAGADAVGFVFYEKSPRFVTVERAREICSKLPSEIEKIGVFVDPHSDAIGALKSAGLTGTQTYIWAEGLGGAGGPVKASGTSCLPQNVRFMIAFPMSLISEDINQFEQMATAFAQSRSKEPDLPTGMWDTFLLDSGSSHVPGGTGRAFDWKEANSLVESMQRNGLKLVVAGGLTAVNVSEAIRVLHPWGVDVASGVELRPGKKDPEKVRAFVKAVREYDARVS